MKTLISIIFVLLVYLVGFLAGERNAGNFVCPETNTGWFSPHPIEKYNIEE